MGGFHGLLLHKRPRPPWPLQRLRTQRRGVPRSSRNLSFERLKLMINFATASRSMKRACFAYPPFVRLDETAYLLRDHKPERRLGNVALAGERLSRSSHGSRNS